MYIARHVIKRFSIFISAEILLHSVYCNVMLVDVPSEVCPGSLHCKPYCATDCTTTVVAQLCLQTHLLDITYTSA